MKEKKRDFKNSILAPHLWNYIISSSGINKIESEAKNAIKQKNNA